MSVLGVNEAVAASKGSNGVDSFSILLRHVGGPTSRKTHSRG